MNPYTGVKVKTFNKETIELLYQEKEILLSEQSDSELQALQNLYVVCKDSSGSNSSALARVKKDKLTLLDPEINCSNVYPRNKEQRMAMDALIDDTIKVVTLTGRAGTGKTLLTDSSLGINLQFDGQSDFSSRTPVARMWTAVQLQTYTERRHWHKTQEEDYKRGLRLMNLNLMEPTPGTIKDDRMRFV